MKSLIRKQVLYLFLIALPLFVSSCDKDEDDQENSVVNYSAVDTVRAAQADNTIEGTYNLIETAYVEGVDGRNSSLSLFPACVQLTFFPNGNGGEITVDFGQGCQLNNGALVSGSIQLEVGPLEAGTRTIVYSFVEFTYNGNGVSGGGTILREIANENNNPQSTLNESIVVSFPNTQVTATRDGLRVAEWVEGVGSGTWLDNVYSITGNWTTVFTNGFERSGLVTQPLRRELSCIYLVSGTLEIQQEGLTGSIDWGSGDCDNQATLIFNGQEFPIVL